MFAVGNFEEILNVVVVANQDEFHSKLCHWRLNQKLEMTMFWEIFLPWLIGKIYEIFRVQIYWYVLKLCLFMFTLSIICFFSWLFLQTLFIMIIWYNCVQIYCYISKLFLCISFFIIPLFFSVGNVFYWAPGNGVVNMFMSFLS